MMAFTRNTGTNVFPMILSLFLEIGGTGSRILNTLSNAGACNSMIHATNVAIISLPDADLSAADLDAKKERRGKRAEAKSSDILPTAEDKEKMFCSFTGLVMTLIFAYCPGSSEWENRNEMLKAAEAFITADRPLPPKKTDGRPAGLFDVNEGSKKGIIKILKALQELSGLGEEEWATKAQVIVGDWLASNNIRGARKDRIDDIKGMEHLEYVEEQSTLWHFALNATHMIMRLHFGDSVLDPGSLAKHKGLLNRTWDAEKPNYADAKALIRHSLVSRILYEVIDFAQDFVEEFTITSNVEMSKSVNDDYRAHSQLFIRDTLIFCVFGHAVAFADAGVVLRALKYSFRGAGLHNYARECIEVLVQWEYELTPAMRAAKEQAWFFNRWGLRGRNIASDLYLEQNKFWVKRVNIAKGSGVTVKYIIEKGSAPVEAPREMSQHFGRTFGFATGLDGIKRSMSVKTYSS
ncbi:hypothetical protein DFH09DRAFT_1242761 [Mycena vulgaris]|nr:hypothetical protein DFH09DRAFT_1242761 [Mycena vulgaris]